MTRYLIEAQDVLFFRDGRDLHASDSYTASSQFPPQPGTIYGALRSAILATAGADFNSLEDHFGLGNEHPAIQVAGTRSKTGSLSLRHLGIHDPDGKPLVPVPADVRVLQKSMDLGVDKHEYRILNPIKLTSGSVSDSDMLWTVGTEEKEPLKDASGYLSSEHYSFYLNARSLPDGAVRPASEFWVRESRTHVAIESEYGTAADSMLFAIPFVRFQHGSGITIDVDGDNGLLGTVEWLKLGGEGRVARILEAEASSSAHRIAQTTGMIRVIITSPSPFAKGWLPDKWTETGKFPFLGGEAEFQGCVVNRHSTVSGWDLAQHRPKPSRRAVAVGSVYYLKVNDLNPELLKTHPSLCIHPDDIRIGYGTFHIGNL